MLDLYLVRHGETADNRQHRYLGRRDLPLSAFGLEQARTLAQQLQGIVFNRIYTSPLTRSVQTATAIASAHNLAVTADPRWVELDFGCWDGLTFSEVGERYPHEQQRWLIDPEHVAPPLGETVAQLRGRVQSALHEIIHTHCEGAVLIVTHGGPIRLAMNLLTNIPIWDVEIPCGGVCHLGLDRSGDIVYAATPDAGTGESIRKN